MEQKYIDFDLSYKYFIKDKGAYDPCNCHMNTYVAFYGCNYLEVDNRPKDFNFVTGLITLEDGDLKVCVTHSWVEYMGCVVDVTSLANSMLKLVDNYDESDVEEFEEVLENKISYIQYKVLSNQKIQRKFNEFGMRYGTRSDAFKNEISKYLLDIAQSVEKDEDFLNRVKTKYGFEFKLEGFQVGF